MTLRVSASIAVTLAFLTACASNPASPQSASVTVPQSRSGPVPPKQHGIHGCYGTFGVEAVPCPVKLTKKNGGAVTVSVSGPNVALAVVIASDCVGSGSICNVSQTGYTQFAISSVPGRNICGTAYVVFEGVTSSGSPVGTATVRVVNKYC